MTLEGSIGEVATARRPIGRPWPASVPARPFTFSGRAPEYFGIWIVNILLTIVTLGIYSAWAKVRTKQYFYGNTRLDGTPLHYLARPLTILKGRIVVLVAFGAWAAISQIYPEFDLLMLFLVLPAVTPWIVVRALRFTTRNTSWRHLRFDFAGSSRKAFGVYVLLWAAAILTLGLLHPYGVYRRTRYRVENLRYGETPFTFDAAARAFNRAYLVAAAIILASLLAAAVPVVVSGAAPALLENTAEETSWRLAGTDAILFLLAVLLLVIGVALAFVHVGVAVANLTWNHTRIGDLRFRLELSFPRMLWIRLSNLAAIALSLGLMIPWARVRVARYQVSRLQLIGAGALDRFLAGEVQRQGATGAEMGEALELDLGL